MKALAQQRPGRGPLRAWRALCGAALLALAGCAELPQPPLALGMNARLGFDPLVLARDRGLLDPSLVKAVELPSGTEVQRAFNNGLLDAAALTLDEALRLADAGAQLRIVAVLESASGSDQVLAKAGIRAPNELRGEPVAVEDSSVGALVLQRMLERAGLSRADVVIVNLEAHAHLDALREGRVAAAVSYAPISAALRSAGYRTLFRGREMAGEVTGVLVVRSSVLSERPEAVDALLRGWQQGLRALLDDPASAALTLSRGTDWHASDYEARLRRLLLLPLAESLRELDGPGLEARSRAAAEALLAIGALRRAPVLSELVDGSPLRRVLAEEDPS